MRRHLFEELAPLCPRCLHAGGIRSAVALAEVIETRAGTVWHGLLHCSNTQCWLEFPVIDGVPVIVPDPAATMANMRLHLLLRDDLPERIESAIGDACGPGSELDALRQHLGLYAGTHFADRIDATAPAQIADIQARGLSALPRTDGAALDIGTAVGRGAMELVRAGFGPVIGADLNLSMLRFAQKLMIEGQARFPRRRVGLVYDRVTVDLPGDVATDRLDFWAVDCTAMPFESGRFSTVAALNLLDCVAAPARMLAELARMLHEGGGAVLTTPYDWSPNATDASGWLGGHSQRGAHAGASEPVLFSELARAGLSPVLEERDVPWTLPLHDRSVMHYSLHLVAAVRNVEPAAAP